MCGWARAKLGGTETLKNSVCLPLPLSRLPFRDINPMNRKLVEGLSRIPPRCASSLRYPTAVIRHHDVCRVEVAMVEVKLRIDVGLHSNVKKNTMETCLTVGWRMTDCRVLLVRLI